MEAGQWSETEMGTPQGGGELATAGQYLHFVFDLWVNRWCKKYAFGDAIVGR